MLLFCLMFAMSLYASVYLCFVVTCWEPSDLFALVCGVKLLVCNFPFGILGQVWYLIVSTPDLCTLTYFDIVNEQGNCLDILCDYTIIMQVVAASAFKWIMKWGSHIYPFTLYKSYIEHNVALLVILFYL